MPYVTGIREEELKNKVAADWFADYDCTRIVGNIDFCVSVPADDPRQIDLFERESHLWAEAKAGTHRDLREAFVQLILTIGKARTFDKVLPPAFLGAFDASRIAFLPYSTILEVFYQNDFNWNVTPSDHETKEFRQLAEQVDQTLQSETLTFRYAEDAEELRSFIHRNFVIGKRGISRIHVTKSNFVSIYLKWLDVVKPTIDVDWGVAKRNGILDADFYLADILSNNNLTLKEKLLKKQEYLAAALGENWQDEYIVWDCCAGTGNLLTGLTNKYAIWASTLDQADVDVMRDRIRNGANLLDTHVFRFDFLNDSFDTLPEGLRAIIRDPERRKKLVLYINPPYAEAGDAKQSSGTGKNKTNVSNATQAHVRFIGAIGPAARELFVQFLMTAYDTMPGCVIANFSTLKHIQAQNFEGFREHFSGAFQRGFIVPANTFDNVKGEFPIGFMVWKTEGEKHRIGSVSMDVYESDGEPAGTRSFAPVQLSDFIINWLRAYYDKNGDAIGFLRIIGPDVQNDNGEFITNTPSSNDIKKCHTVRITRKNILASCVYFSVRHVVEHTWQNDRDQYTIPNEDVMKNGDFVSDCLAYALFHGQNRINEGGEGNHWIPFTESEVDAKDTFASHFMTDFMAGKIRSETKKEGDLFGNAPENTALVPTAPMVFSTEAKAVFDAGRALWRYYHAQPGANPNAAFYDIREFFQGRDSRGRMNPDSPDETYTALIAALRVALKTLAKRIEPKVYEYGFLRR